MITIEMPGHSLWDGHRLWWSRSPERVGILELPDGVPVLIRHCETREAERLTGGDGVPRG